MQTYYMRKLKMGVCLLALSAVSAFSQSNAAVTGLTVSGDAGVTNKICGYNPYIVTLQGKASSTTHVSLSMTGPARFYEDNKCLKQINNLSIPSNGSVGEFYVKSSSPGTSTMRVSIDGVASARVDKPVITYNALDVMNPLQGSNIPAAKGNDLTNDSDSLNKAIIYASKNMTKDFADGPLGAQAIVYIPKGTYRIRNVNMADNVRVEVDAGAVFKHCTTESNCKAEVGAKIGDSLFKFDAPIPTNRVYNPPLKNVTLIGVGNSLENKPTKPYNNWDLSRSFTVNVDPVTTNASQEVEVVSLFYTEGVLLQNLYSKGNNSTQKGAAFNNPVVKFKAHAESTLAPDGSGMYAPKNVRYINHYNEDAVKGGGCTQLQSARDVFMDRIFTTGTENTFAVRLETDLVGSRTLQQNGCNTARHGDENYPNCKCTAAKPCELVYFSELNNITINNAAITGGTAAVGLIPHNQLNQNIFINNPTGQSMAIYEGVSGKDERLPNPPYNGFKNLVVTNPIPKWSR